MSENTTVKTTFLEAAPGMDFGPHEEPIPIPTPISEPFFRGARQNKLILQKCPRDGFFYYPRSRCPKCLGNDWKWEETSGQGKVRSFVIDRVGFVPGFRKEVPYIVSIIELDEGPTMPARISGCPPEAVTIGAKVKAKAVPRGNVHIFEFELA